MTEQAASNTESSEPLFSPVELEKFEKDDVAAGSAIGKMLSLLFLYTVIAMTIVAIWTYTSVMNSEENTDSQQTPAAADSAHSH